MTALEANRYARLAGLLLLVSLVAGGFGESYIPAKLLAPNSLAETAHRVESSLGLIRLSFAAYLVGTKSQKLKAKSEKLKAKS